MAYKILLIDDDDEFAELLKTYLEAEEFKISIANDGEKGLKSALNQNFDAIILDIMIPKLNGFEVLKGIREHLSVPVMMLTARGDDIDKIVGFEVGADDYVSKPCNPRELIVRLKAILRRSQQKTPSTRPNLEHGNIFIDCTKRMVLVSGKEIELTNAEFNILEMLMKSPGQAFSKEELTEYALGRKFTAYDRSIDVHVSNLRNKVGHNEKKEDWIKTVRGFGYTFNA